MSYYKEHNPTLSQLQAVEREDKIRKVSCEKILEKYRKEQEDKKIKSLLIPKTKKK